MKVLILGGAGLVAYATTKDLLEFDRSETSEIMLADINYEKLQMIEKELNDEKVSITRCDIEDHTSLVKLMKNYDIVINEAGGKFALAGLKAALEAGVHTTNIMGPPLEAMKLNDDFKEAGLTAVINLGSSPGNTNVVSRYLVDKLDAVNTIYMSFAYAELTKDVLFVPFAGAVDEFINNVTVFQDGKFIELPPQSGQEDELFPAPIGLRRMINVPHPEIRTFPIAFKEKGIQNVMIKGGFIPDFIEKINFLISLGVISKEPLQVKDQTIVPLDFFNAVYAKLSHVKDRVDYGCVRVVVRGQKSGEEIEYNAEMLSRPYKNLTGVQHRTGPSPAIGARMISRGQIKKRGVFPPEMVVPPLPYFKEVARRNLIFSLEEKHFI